MTASPHPEESRSGSAESRQADVNDARAFALSEDWLATIVGLGIVALAAAGVITADWIPV